MCCVLSDLKCTVNCFFFNDTATTEIYTLSLHDALPIYDKIYWHHTGAIGGIKSIALGKLLKEHPERALEFAVKGMLPRSEEHTSELQSRQYLVCRLLLEKKNTTSFTTCFTQPALACCSV